MTDLNSAIDSYTRSIRDKSSNTALRLASEAIEKELRTIESNIESLVTDALIQNKECIVVATTREFKDCYHFNYLELPTSKRINFDKFKEIAKTFEEKGYSFNHMRDTDGLEFYWKAL